MGYTINQNKGRVTDVTCDECQKIVPFSQPELSKSTTEVTVMGHSCPPQILVDTQEALAAAAESVTSSEA